MFKGNKKMNNKETAVVFLGFLLIAISFLGLGVLYQSSICDPVIDTLSKTQNYHHLILYYFIKNSRINAPHILISSKLSISNIFQDSIFECPIFPPKRLLYFLIIADLKI